MAKVITRELTRVFWERFSHMFNFNEGENPEELLPDYLYHYTNIDGMMGIIKHNNLWMTKSDFLNDSNEIIHLEKLKHEILTEFRRRMTEEYIQNPICEEFIRQFENALRKRFNDDQELYEIYILSLTDKSDSLVLWGNYAEGDGYSIGFESKPLVEQLTRSLEDINVTVVFGNIIYDQKEQVRSMVEILEYAFEEILKLESSVEELEKELPLFFKTIIMTYSMFFKDESFKVEEEFRIAVTFREKAEVEFRSNQGNIIPYISSEINPLPIKNIVIGPKNNSDIAEKGINIFLERHGYNLDDIEINKSKVPLRY